MVPKTFDTKIIWYLLLQFSLTWCRERFSPFFRVATAIMSREFGNLCIQKNLNNLVPNKIGNKLFWYQIILVPNYFCTKFFCYQILLVTNSFATKFFCYQILLVPNYFNTKLFWYQIILVPNYFVYIINFSNSYVQQSIISPKKRTKPFSAPGSIAMGV